VIAHPIAFMGEIGFRKINHDTSTATATCSVTVFSSRNRGETCGKKT
jgi:hypothetical protein